MQVNGWKKERAHEIIVKPVNLQVHCCAVLREAAPVRWNSWNELQT